MKHPLTVSTLFGREPGALTQDTAFLFEHQPRTEPGERHFFCSPCE